MPRLVLPAVPSLTAEPHADGPGVLLSVRFGLGARRPPAWRFFARAAVHLAAEVDRMGPPLAGLTPLPPPWRRLGLGRRRGHTRVAVLPLPRRGLERGR